MKLETLKVTLWVTILPALFFAILIYFYVPTVNIKIAFEILGANYFVIAGFLIFVLLSILSFLYYLAFIPFEKSLKKSANKIINELNTRKRNQKSKEEKFERKINEEYRIKRINLENQYENKAYEQDQRSIKINNIEEDLKTRLKEFEVEKLAMENKINQQNSINIRLARKNKKLEEATNPDKLL